MLINLYLAKPQFSAKDTSLTNNCVCVCGAERGFINLTDGEDRVVEVREGESLTLSVEITSYPKPNDVYWTYNNQELQNTSEHVITLHNQQYRYTNT